MALFLLSLTGIPPLAGFWAKAYVILAAIQAGGWLTVLAVLAMVNAAAAAFYYLRVVVYMYMREPAEEVAPSSPGPLFRTGLAVAGWPRWSSGSSRRWYGRRERGERLPRIAGRERPSTGENEARPPIEATGRRRG